MIVQGADPVILRSTISSISTNRKPVQERKSCCDRKNNQVRTPHSAHQCKAKQNSQEREDNAAGQVEALLIRHFPAQRGQRGTGNSIGEKTRQGGESGVPTERAHQGERPQQNGESNNGGVGRLITTVNGAKPSGEIALLGKGKSQSRVGDHVGRETPETREEGAHGNDASHCTAAENIGCRRERVISLRRV